MYLTCRHHATPAESFVLGHRGFKNSYCSPRARDMNKSLQKFLLRHANCGNGFDHFTLSYGQKKDNDLPAKAAIIEGVHSAISNAAKA